MDMPVPSKRTYDNDGELTDQESSFILDKCLKPKERTNVTMIQFINSFVRCKNVGQASDEVGIKASLGYRWRHRNTVNNAIVKLIEKSSVKYGFDASELVERVREISDVDPIHFMNADGTYKESLAEIPAEVRRTIKKFECKNIYDTREDLNGMKTKIVIGKLIKVELYDKMKSFDLLGREKDLFKVTTKVEHDVTKNMADVLLASKKLGAAKKVEFIDVTPEDEDDE